MACGFGAGLSCGCMTMDIDAGGVLPVRYMDSQGNLLGNA